MEWNFNISFPYIYCLEGEEKEQTWTAAGQR